jgi:hypothetical protein
MRKWKTKGFFLKHEVTWDPMIDLLGLQAYSLSELELEPEAVE